MNLLSDDPNPVKLTAGGASGVILLYLSHLDAKHKHKSTRKDDKQICARVFELL